MGEKACAAMACPSKELDQDAVWFDSCMYVGCGLHSRYVGGHERYFPHVITYKIEFPMDDFGVMIRFELLTCALPIRKYICRTYVGKYRYSSTNPKAR